MKKKCSLLMVMLIVLTMIISAAAVPVSAETTYTPISGSTTIVKNLVVDSDANIPDVTFNYTLRRGTPVAATATTIEILASNTGGGTIEPAVFSNADTANCINGLPTDEDPSSPTSGKKYAQKEITIVLADNSFTKPGVYRYEISEVSTPALPGVVYDESPNRYLDVFVIADEDNVLSVDSYVLRDEATAINSNGSYSTDPEVKSSGYTNSITQYDFEFSKTIAGNQGDKNKRFNFTVSISGANPGTYPIEATDVTDNPTSITVTSNGTASASFKLTDGSSLKILDLNEGAVCQVKENAEDYTATYTLDAGDSVSGSDSGAITLYANHLVAFTNTRNGIIPTGVIVAVAPFAIGICVFGAVLIFIAVKRKRRPY